MGGSEGVSDPKEADSRRVRILPVPKNRGERGEATDLEAFFDSNGRNVSTEANSERTAASDGLWGGFFPRRKRVFQGRSFRQAGRLDGRRDFGGLEQVLI